MRINWTNSLCAVFMCMLKCEICSTRGCLIVANDDCTMYDIGDLKNDPERLYDMCVRFSQFFQTRSKNQTAEIWYVLEKVNNSLWGNLPPVVIMDYRDPDDPNTWGEYGEPPGIPGALLSDPVPVAEPKLYTLGEAASFFSVSKSTISRWIKSGLLPAVRLGGRVYVDESVIDAVRLGLPIPAQNSNYK